MCQSIVYCNRLIHSSDDGDDALSRPLSYMPLPLEGDGEMLSTWPDMDCMVPRYRPIDNSIMQQLRVKDFVGYATNVTNIKRNTALLSPISYNRSQSNNSGSSSGSNLSNVLEAPVVDTEVEKAFTLQEPSTPTKKVRPPKKYRVVQINSSRLDNDAAHVATFYNKTRFGSLEHTLPESYCNPLLQVLNAQPFLRRYCISHLCDQEFCATCELGFLFRTSDDTIQPPHRTTLTLASPSCRHAGCSTRTQLPLEQLPAYH